MDNVDRISAKYPGNTYRIYFGVPDPVRVIIEDSKYRVPMSDKDEGNKFNRDIY
ncbi:hypothetical protein [Clostridium sp.]|uniref:hypothetical protein n=1 Tax=Clostridium sp. TaxID=1506 RepID=UPI003D6D5E7F